MKYLIALLLVTGNYTTAKPITTKSKKTGMKKQCITCTCNDNTIIPEEYCNYTDTTLGINKNHDKEMTQTEANEHCKQKCDAHHQGNKKARIYS